MASIGRRLDRIEAAFAPPVTEEVQRVVDGILADAPEPSRSDDPHVVATIARFPHIGFPRLAHPLQWIELAQRIAAGRRRVYALEYGQDALEGFEQGRDGAR